MSDFYLPIEKPEEKKNFGSSRIRFKDSKGKEKRLGDSDDPQSFFTRLRSKEPNKERFSEDLKNMKAKHSDEKIFDTLNKIIEKDE
jgi:hypothetical protein